MKYLLSNQVTPGAAAMSLAEFKLMARIDTTAEDSFIGSILNAATEEAEEYLQASLMAQTRVAYVDAPEPIMVLNFGPVLEITKIEYDNVDGQTTALSSSTYSLLNDMVSLAPNASWPILGGNAPYPMRITYRAGVVDDSVSPAVGVLPDRIKMAVGLLGNIMYDRNPAAEDMLRRSAHRLLDYTRNGQGL